MTSYLSLFSGAGGLEHPSVSPILVCENDPVCGRILKRRLDGVDLHLDVRTLAAVAPRAEFVVGGWPCQDISAAGKMSGIDGTRSGLFFDMLRTAKHAQAHTLVGENVPNLLSLNKGDDFRRVLIALVDAGYPYISWRKLNARQFGLPQERNRIFVVASKKKELALALHAAQPVPLEGTIRREPKAAGFYWTAGGRSICYNVGYTPALKIGASDGKGRSVVAVLHDGVARKLSAEVCAKLQGFDPLDFEGESKTNIVRMAGNAVPVPMGEFVLRNVFAGASGPVRYVGTGMQLGFSRFSESGLYEDGAVWAIQHPRVPLANNLDDFVMDNDGEQLSGQAAAGLIVRTIRAGKPLPTKLFDVLLERTQERSSYRGSRSNSFELLDGVDVSLYRRLLEPVGHVEIPPVQEEERQRDLFAR